MYKYKRILFENIILIDKESKPNIFYSVKGNKEKVEKSIYKEPNLIYHYTTINALISILQTRNLWLSSISESNDGNEGNSFLLMLTNYIKKQSLHLNDRIILIRLIELIRSNLCHTYFASLSAQKDKMCQWHLYGDKGKGVSIGFSTEDIPITKQLPSRVPNPKISTALLKINYNEHEHLKTIKNIFRDMNCQNLDINEAASYLTKLSLTCKEKGWEEEQEWRIIHTPDFGRNPNEELVSGDIKISGIKSRTRNQKNIPYFDFSILPHSIKEIIIGPACNLNIEIINNILESTGFDLTQNNINVYKSKINFRN